MITPMDIHNKTFSKQFRGYSQDEVNGFLEELASDYEKIYREHRVMEDEMDTIRTKLRNYEKMESTMSHTLIMAQETADNVKKNATKEAELSLCEAQSEAQKIVADAEVARRQMNADLLKAEGDMNLYIEKLLSNFKSALALIESAKSVRAPQAIQNVAPAPAEEALAPAAEVVEAPAAPEVMEEGAPVEEIAEAPAAEEAPVEIVEEAPAEEVVAPETPVEAPAEEKAEEVPAAAEEAVEVTEAPVEAPAEEVTEAPVEEAGAAPGEETEEEAISEKPAGNLFDEAAAVVAPKEEPKV